MEPTTDTEVKTPQDQVCGAAFAAHWGTLHQQSTLPIFVATHVLPPLKEASWFREMGPRYSPTKTGCWNSVIWPEFCTERVIFEAWVKKGLYVAISILKAQSALVRTQRNVLVTNWGEMDRASAVSRISIRWFGWPPIRVCLRQNGHWPPLIGVDVKSLLQTWKLYWVPIQ